MTTPSQKDAPFSVWITPDCLEKLNLYATEALPTEIGGFAKIEPEDGVIFVTDIFIPKQSATGAYFEVSAEMDAEFMQWMVKNGKRDEIHLWKSIVHSHPVGMGPSMSGTDVEAIKRRAEDDEAFSLIISASRNADSTNMFMHYCKVIYGQPFIWRDIPVGVGWDIERMKYAEKIAVGVTVDLFGKDASDKEHQLVKDAMERVVCEMLPRTNSKDYSELKKQIKADVAEKRSQRTWGGKGGAGSRDPFPSRTGPQGGSGATTTKGGTQMTNGGTPTISSGEGSTLELAWRNAQRLFCIGYEAMDPNDENPNAVISKQQQKRARHLHKKQMIALNNELRKIGGIGMGDLVCMNQMGLASHPEAHDMLSEPHEVEDFQLVQGQIAYEAGGEVFWPEELENITYYEHLMEWEEKKEKQPA